MSKSEQTDVPSRPDTPKSWSRQSKPGPWDAIVIGSGIGGMVTAAILAKLGKRILILEQHYVPGGFTHSFRRPGYQWDVGVHVIGDMTEESESGRLLTALTDDRLRWASLGPVYDSFHLPEDFRIDYPDNERQFRENLVETFPAEARSIDNYLSLARQASDSLRPHFIARALPRSISGLSERLFARKAKPYFQATAGQVMSGLTNDARLRKLFTAQWGYYGTPPSQASYAMQAMIVRHFINGGYYPVGGAGRIARELLHTVAEAGGWTRINASVEKIMLKNGRAVGVRLSDGEEIFAPKVISAVGAPATVSRLLPLAAQGTNWVDQIRQLPISPAHVCLYLGFKGDIRTAGAGRNNHWFYDSWDDSDISWLVSPDSRIDDPTAIYISFPSLKDPLHRPGPEQRHTGEVVVFVPWEPFRPWRDRPWMKRGDNYQMFKQRLQDSLLTQLFRRFPGLKPMLDFAELSTPLSTDHFARPIHGAVYGLGSTPSRYLCPALRCRTPIPNLFLTGVDVCTPGVMGGAMGGIMTACSVAPFRALRWLRREVF